MRKSKKKVCPDRLGLPVTFLFIGAHSTRARIAKHCIRSNVLRLSTLSKRPMNSKSSITTAALVLKLFLFACQSLRSRCTQYSLSSDRYSTSLPWRLWRWGARRSSCSATWTAPQMRCDRCKAFHSTTSPWRYSMPKRSRTPWPNAKARSSNDRRKRLTNKPWKRTKNRKLPEPKPVRSRLVGGRTQAILP